MLKVEGVREIRHVRSSPRRDLARDDILALGGVDLLDELDLRAVIGVLDVNISASGPWRDDVEWKTEPWAGVHVAVLGIRVLNPFTV